MLALIAVDTTDARLLLPTPSSPPSRPTPAGCSRLRRPSGPADPRRLLRANTQRLGIMDPQVGTIDECASASAMLTA